MQTRPTSDRLRETLFNVLAPRVAGARFLDLCAGTGAIGIEALSRGASFVTFVERVHKMCALVEANLDLLAVPEELTEVVKSDASEYVRRTVRGAGQPARRRHFGGSGEMLWIFTRQIDDKPTAVGCVRWPT